MAKRKFTAGLAILGALLCLGALTWVSLTPDTDNPPLQERNAVDAAGLSLYFRLQSTVITCTLSTTTTDAIPYNVDFAHAATLADYNDLALVTGNQGDDRHPEKDYFRLNNAVPGWKYRVQAIPDGVGNYNLGIIAYDSNYQAILTDTNTFDGNSAYLELPATSAGPYYFVVSQISDQCSGGTYYLVVSVVEPTATPTPTPTPAPGTPTATPVPPWSTGYDQYEPNYNFDTATTIAPEVPYDLNFIPWGGASVDNDYFKMWVKPGLFFTCETANLDPGVDTNIQFYDANRNLLGGNDDKELGDYSSRFSYYSTYEGYLYVLVGQGGRMSLPDTTHSEYDLSCTKAVPGIDPTPGPDTTPVPSKDQTPVPTATPSPATSPLATPTATPDTDSSVELSFHTLTTPPPVTPTPVPSGFRTFRLIIYYDGNNDGQFGAGEGIAGFFVRVLSSTTGEELARSYTDEQGQLSFTVPTISTVRVSVPLLGFDRFVNPETPEVKVRIVPLPLPKTIP
ncbi:MAG: hypothetical protein J7M17_03465 [Anaerolineae bacterium]|nr:hypothetical protein [Anaerolineae bacterium]